MTRRTPFGVGLHIALAAMFFRALLPSGWMPAPTAQAEDAPWLSFIICTSEGLTSFDDGAADFYQVSPDTPTHDDTVHSYSSCPYATTAPLATFAAGVDLALYPIGFRPTVFHTAERTLFAKDLFQRERSRAPPLLAS